MLNRHPSSCAGVDCGSTVCPRAIPVAASMKRTRVTKSGGSLRTGHSLTQAGSLDPAFLIRGRDKIGSAEVPMHTDARSLTPDAALERLIEGNARFVRGEARFQTAQKDIIASLAYAQNPFATILGCSDSRVPPELVFDVGFGDLFIIRVAGNVISPGVIGSLQYAALHLRTPLFVVLGHERCGAVSAALEARHGTVEHPPPLMHLLNKII